MAISTTRLAFDLDKVVPADHLVRQIDGVLDLEWVHKELADLRQILRHVRYVPILLQKSVAGFLGR